MSLRNLKFKYFELNESMTFKTLQGAQKEVLREEFVVLNIYVQ